MRKKNIAWLSAALAAAAVSCEPSHLNDNMYEPAVYIVNNGLTQEEFYVVEETYTFEVNAYCGGIENLNPDVSVIVDAKALDKWSEDNGQTLALLPEDCYTIEKGVKTMQDSRASFSLVFDCAKLEALSSDPNFEDLRGYAVPLTLVSHTEGVSVSQKGGISTAIIVPDMKPMGFSFDQAGVRELNLDSFKDEGGYVYADYRIFTSVENHWTNPVTFDFNVDVDDARYPKLPEGSYTVSSTADGFADGISEIVYTVKIDKSAIPESHYTLSAKVTSGGTFKVQGEGLSVTELFNAHQFDREKMSVASCNSYVKGAEPEKTIDGNISTKWEAAYNKSSSSSVGVFELPFEIVYEFDEEVTIRGVEAYRRSDQYASDLKAGKYYVSMDGVTFTEAMDFDYTGLSGGGPFLHVCEPVKARFLKFSATEAGRTASGNIPVSSLCELVVFYY